MKLQELHLIEHSRSAEGDARGLNWVFRGIGKKLIEEYGDDVTSDRGQTLIDQERASWPNVGMRTMVTNEWRLEGVTMDDDEKELTERLIKTWAVPLLDRWLERRFATQVKDTLSIDMDDPDDNETRIYFRFRFLAHDFLDYTEELENHLL